MKKQLRKAMICTVAMMLVAVLTLTGVTYAWFSESDSADVNGLDLSVVKTEGGVYISTTPADPGSFGTSVTIAPKTDEIFRPVSTSCQLYTDEGDNYGMMKFYEGELTSPNDATVTSKEILPANKNGRYIFSEVYFDNSTGASDITVSLEDTEIKPTSEGTASTHLAARVAIATYGSISQETYNNGAGVEEFPDMPSNVQVYENNSATHTTQGKNEYKKLFPATTIFDTTYTYYALTRATTAEENGADGAGGVNRFSKDGEWLKEMTTITDPSAVTITVPANSYLKIGVYVWLEGQDADCQNNISGNKFTAAIVFKQV